MTPAVLLLALALALAIALAPTNASAQGNIPCTQNTVECNATYLACQDGPPLDELIYATQTPTGAPVTPTAPIPPTFEPTLSPTQFPTKTPSSAPSATPTASPTEPGTLAPSASPVPPTPPTLAPSYAPTTSPTLSRNTGGLQARILAQGQSGAALFFKFRLTSCSGEYMVSLPVERFAVKQNGRLVDPLETPLVDIQLEGGYTSVVALLIVDFSGSVTSDEERFRSVTEPNIQAFVDGILAADADTAAVTLGVYVFAGNTGGSRALHEVLPFTNDAADIRSVMPKLQDARDKLEDTTSTDLYGALIESVDLIEQQAGFDDYVCVVYTDGLDEAGLWEEEEAVEKVTESNARFIVLGSGTQVTTRKSQNFFNSIGEAHLQDSDDLTEVFLKVTNDFAPVAQSTYTLGLCSPIRAGEGHEYQIMVDANVIPDVAYDYRNDSFGRFMVPIMTMDELSMQSATAGCQQSLSNPCAVGYDFDIATFQCSLGMPATAAIAAAAALAGLAIAVTCYKNENLRPRMPTVPRGVARAVKRPPRGIEKPLVVSTISDSKVAASSTATATVAAAGAGAGTGASAAKARSSAGVEPAERIVDVKDEEVIKATEREMAAGQASAVVISVEPDADSEPAEVLEPEPVAEATDGPAVTEASVEGEKEDDESVSEAEAEVQAEVEVEEAGVEEESKQPDVEAQEVDDDDHSEAREPSIDLREDGAEPDEAGVEAMADASADEEAGSDQGDISVQVGDEEV